MLCLVVVLSSTVLAMQEVVAPRVSVLFEDEALEPFAQRVASEAERALGGLIPLFGAAPEHITLTLDGATDVYNAVAPPLPRPKVALRALFPVASEVGLRAEDDLYLLLVHELTHNLQLTYTEGGPYLPPIGLVGQNVAAVPPSWFLEGIAVWMESQLTRGGRADDALTRGLLASLALDGTWPTLAEAGIITHNPWPGGLTRYLVGAGFVTHLTERHGFEAVLRTLQRYNQKSLFGTFADAWQGAVGTSLGREWALYQQTVRARAEARANLVHAGERRTHTGSYTRAPALSPDGTRLAWVSWPVGIVVADLTDGPERLTDTRTILAGRFPRHLAWLDEDTLLYSRVVTRPESEYSELFALELATGNERALTKGARAQLPAPAPDGCVLFVRDTVPDGVQLRRRCAGEVVTLLTLPEGEHIVSLAVSAAGQVAMSLWQGGFIRVVTLEDDILTPHIQDAAQDLDLAWRGETRLLMRSDRDAVGAFDLYELDLDSKTLRRLTRTVGGAFAPLATAESVWYVGLFGGGYDLVELVEASDAEFDTEFDAEGARVVLEPLPEVRPVVRYPVRPYTPWPSLAPYGWLPTSLRVGPDGLGVSATLFGQDDSGVHSYALTLGYDATLAGVLGGGQLALRYDYRPNDLLNAFQRQNPVGFGVQLGVWPHAPHLAAQTETALGVQGSLRATLPQDGWTGNMGLEAGVVRLESVGAWQLDARAGVVATNQPLDPFGYRLSGLRGGVTGVWSATPEGPSLGLWGDAGLVQSLLPVGLPGSVEASVRAGYRQPPPIPVALGADLAVSAALGYRATVPLGWRFGDGLYALERVTLEPRTRLWVGAQVGLGADLTVSLDTVLNYGAPVSLSGTLGVADGLWGRVGARLPLP